MPLLRSHLGGRRRSIIFFSNGTPASSAVYFPRRPLRQRHYSNTFFSNYIFLHDRVSLYFPRRPLRRRAPRAAHRARRQPPESYVYYHTNNKHILLLLLIIIMISIIMNVILYYYYYYSSSSYHYHYYYYYYLTFAIKVDRRAGRSTSGESASAASGRGRDKRGFHRRATNPRISTLFVSCAHMLPHFARLCHIFSTFPCDISLRGIATLLRRPRLA